jgi:hypothetical protein
MVSNEAIVEIDISPFVCFFFLWIAQLMQP